MFSQEELKSVDSRYFNIITVDDYDVTIQSRNTGITGIYIPPMFRGIRRVSSSININTAILTTSTGAETASDRLFGAYRAMIIDPVQAFIGADVDMNRANEVRPVFRKLGMIAEKTGCAIVLIGHLNRSSGTQSTYRELGSIDIMAAVRSLIFIGKVRKDPTTRVLIHEKSSLAPPGETMAFKLGDEEVFRWVAESLKKI